MQTDYTPPHIVAQGLADGTCPLLLEDSTNTTVAFIDVTGLAPCQGVTSSKLIAMASLALTSGNASVDRSGNITGASLVTSGRNGIMVYSGTTKNSSDCSKWITCMY